jgi:hypothetical protein
MRDSVAQCRLTPSSSTIGSAKRRDQDTTQLRHRTDSSRRGVIGSGKATAAPERDDPGTGLRAGPSLARAYAGLGNSAPSRRGPLEFFFRATSSSGHPAGRVVLYSGRRQRCFFGASALSIARSAAFYAGGVARSLAGFCVTLNAIDGPLP